VIVVMLVAGGSEAGAQPPLPLQLSGPPVVATGVDFRVRGSGAVAGERIRIEVRSGTRWRPLGAAAADAAGRFADRVRPKRPRRMYALRAVGADGRLSAPIVVRSRHVTLAAVGDINLGNGPGLVMSQRGLRFP
jgi:hypothetical protein